MSETPEGYGTQNTPVMGESFPPQTGDLLGAYVARLARTVVELDAERKSKSEEPSAYQRSLEARIERLEAMMSDPEHEPICRDCGQPEHMDGCDAQPEPTEEPTVNTPTVTRERTHGRYGTRNLTKSKPDHIVAANKKVCATCGHPWSDHSDTGGICMGGVMGKPCQCRSFKPVVCEG